MKLSRTSLQKDKLEECFSTAVRHNGKTKNRGQPTGTPTNLYPLETVGYDDPQPDCSSMLNQGSPILTDNHVSTNRHFLQGVEVVVATTRTIVLGVDRARMGARKNTRSTPPKAPKRSSLTAHPLLQPPRSPLPPCPSRSPSPSRPAARWCP